MDDYKAIIDQYSCETGCSTAKICMCALAEDMADEIERLRRALKSVCDSSTKMSAKSYKDRLADTLKTASAALGEGK